MFENLVEKFTFLIAHRNSEVTNVGKDDKKKWTAALSKIQRTGSFHKECSDKKEVAFWATLYNTRASTLFLKGPRLYESVVKLFAKIRVRFSG